MHTLTLLLTLTRSLTFTIHFDLGEGSCLFGVAGERLKQRVATGGLHLFLFTSHSYSRSPFFWLCFLSLFVLLPFPIPHTSSC